MASYFMRVDGVNKTNGIATVTGLEGEGWFKITSFAWAAFRNVGMEIGNGSNQDAGVGGVSPFSVSKEVDGATASLLSFFFAPGPAGADMQMVTTKSTTDGQGVEITASLAIKCGRMTGFSISGEPGNEHENITVVYQSFEWAFYPEEAGGTLGPAEIVGYNVAKAVLESGVS